MDEQNPEKDTSLERTSTPGRSWPGASLYKSLKLGWHWRRLRWAVVAASEAAQGHEANGLPQVRRNSKRSLTRSSARFRSIPTESGDPIDTLKARLPALCALERLAHPDPVVPQNKAWADAGHHHRRGSGVYRNGCADRSWNWHGPLDRAPVRIRRRNLTGILETVRSRRDRQRNRLSGELEEQSPESQGQLLPPAQQQTIPI